MRKNKREQGFAAILVVLSFAALVVLVGISYFFGVNKMGTNITIPTPIVSTQPAVTPTVKPMVDPTADWKTYTNTEFNYTFKFPETHKIRSFGGSQMDSSKANSISLELINSESYAQIIASKDSIVSFELKPVDSIGGYKTYFAVHPNGYPDDPTPFVVIELRDGSRSTQFIFRNMIKIDDLANQILSTFKFTN